MVEFTIKLQQTTFICHLAKKNRKNINLRIKVDNNIYLSKPKHVSQRKLKKYLISNQAWIISKSKQINLLKQKRDNHLNSEHVYIFNKKYKFKSSNINTIKFYDNYILVNPKTNQKDFQMFLNDILLEYIKSNRNYLDEYIHIYKIIKPKIIIKDIKSKWGVCYINKNVIYISQRLIHYPKFCIDYVVLHEYAHFIQPNHSKDFYKIIESIMPNYKDAVRYLKTN